LKRAILKRAAKIIVPVIGVERPAGETLDKRIHAALRCIISYGRIAGGTRLPSSRILAPVLGVSRNTILSAYEELACEGWLKARVGSGTRVSGSARIKYFDDCDGLSFYCVEGSKH
jgi:GntR family transcriptional regulator / MocR family aminotransferase